MNDQFNMLNAEAVEYKLDVAGMGARAHAFSIDWHIRLLLALVWFILAASILSWDTVREIVGSAFDDDAASAITHSAAAIFIFAPTLAIYFLYHPVLEVIMRGHTPGKRMAGVRVVTQAGHSPSAGALLVRNVFRLLDSLPGLYFVGLIAVAMTRNHVRIGDLAADLVLVYDAGVTKKQIEAATHLALNSTISVQQQELLLELLERWPEMEVGARIRLGEKLLHELSKEPVSRIDKPPGISEKKYSRAIFKDLQKLVRSG